ncbi:MAG: preprotein translocase subunit SecA [Gemmataceae bacterium]|nr:preprotein translocase subunit SecA [Gemmataceae bacterium]
MSEAVIDEPEVRDEPLVLKQSTPGRLGSSFTNFFQSIFGTPWDRRLAKAALMIPSIRSWEKKYENLNETELKGIAAKLRGRARGGENLDKMLPEAFALVCIAAIRTLKMRPFDVQLAAGAVMHYRALVELATGEGKTLTASLPTFLNALTGKGVHVATVNDYLAKRDSDWIGPVFKLLGMSVGCLQQQMPEPERKKMYQCDITYGTASEFGFDFLRDQMKLRGGEGGTPPFWAAWGEDPTAGVTLDPKIQRELNFAVVDEADSIFIDEARTPLIIGMPTREATPEESVVYVWADQVVRKYKIGEHFTYDIKKDKVELTEAGRQLARYSNPPSGEHSHAMDKLHEALEKAIQAHYRFLRDQHYMITDEKKIVIIDEFTGRPMPDRHWRDGLHQAVEAKEGVPITFGSDHAAKITFQSYFRLYKKLAGMSGTLLQNFWELRRVYKIWVVPVPTNRPCIRKHLPDRVFPTLDAKFDAITENVKKLMLEGRPVLIGTRSVEMSEKLSEKLSAEAIPHQVLNARQNEQEANIVADAGQRGKITIATNMAGRGTDIKLGPGVAEAGGLAVIGTERHEARRIDRQLIGRSARQGDPGTGQFFLSLEDELLEAIGHARQEKLIALGQKGGNLDWDRFVPVFLKAQKKTEKKHYRQRLDLMFHEKQRKETLEDLGADPYVD